jgi:hypothetical protein
LAKESKSTGGSSSHGKPPYGRLSTLTRISSLTTEIWLARFSSVIRGLRIRSASRKRPRDSALLGSTSKKFV